MSFKLAEYSKCKVDLPNRIIAVLVVIPLMILSAHNVVNVKGAMRVMLYLVPLAIIWNPNLNPRRFTSRWGEKDRHALYTRILGWIMLLLMGFINFIPQIILR